MRTPFFRNKIFRRTGMSGFRAECRERSIFNLTCVFWTGEFRAETRGFSSALNLAAYVFRRTSLSSVPIREIRGSNSVAFDFRPELPATTTPSAWFGFRLRVYKAWRDLEKFFPAEGDELKNELQGIWKRNWFSGSRFQVSGFALRKLGGLKLRLLGYREHASFRSRKLSSF